MDDETTVDACSCWTHDAASGACGWCGTWTPPADVETLASQRARLASLVSALVACDENVSPAGDTLAA